MKNCDGLLKALDIYNENIYGFVNMDLIPFPPSNLPLIPMSFSLKKITDNRGNMVDFEKIILYMPQSGYTGAS
jgi:hypothetical protein